MTDEQKKQFTLRISQANKSELVIILYDIFVAYAKDAISYSAPFNEKKYHSSVAKARDTVGELIASVNPVNKLATNYRSLYGYALRQLSAVDVNRDTKIIEQLISMMTSLKDAYQVVVEKDSSPAVMGNVQSVYAGLTYGKNTLTENLADTDNRGFFA